MTLRADSGSLVEDENFIPTTSLTNNIDFLTPSTSLQTNLSVNVKTNAKSKNNNNENSTSICPMIVFPLGGEKYEDLGFPTTVLHYSVSPDARFIYVIGKEYRNLSKIYVWDLHRGIRLFYDYETINNIRHFYAINKNIGIVVSSTYNQERFYLYTVIIDHNQQRIIVEDRITTYTTFGHVGFWSSCRYNNYGIIFALVDHNGAFIYKYEYTSNPLDKTNQKSIYIRREDLENYYFGGQPFVFNDHVMFLEREMFTLKFTGRIVRIRLDNGKIDIVMTTAASGTNLFVSQYNENEIPSRIKHVERNGQLWSIIENSTINLNPINGNTYTSKTEKILGVLCLKTWCWRVIQLNIKATYEEISLDVTFTGTIVIIKRSKFSESPTVSGIYFLQNRY